MLNTFVFIGRSGCGKGTQAGLIKERILKDDPKAEIFYLETGARFREFIEKNTYSSNLSKKVYDLDHRQPDFLAVWNWAHLFVDSLKGTEHLIIDGTPRSVAEAYMLDSALDFYNRKNPYIVHIDVSKEWSRKHLLSRGRVDDANLLRIDKRLAWFDSDVVPAIEYYRKRTDYHFIEVNGEQSIEDVHKDIVKQL